MSALGTVCFVAAVLMGVVALLEALRRWAGWSADRAEAGYVPPIVRQIEADVAADEEFLLIVREIEADWREGA